MCVCLSQSVEFNLSLCASLKIDFMIDGKWENCQKWFTIIYKEGLQLLVFCDRRFNPPPAPPHVFFLPHFAVVPKLTISHRALHLICLCPAAFEGAAGRTHSKNPYLTLLFFHANQENVKAVEEQDQIRLMFLTLQRYVRSRSCILFIYAIGRMWTWRDLAVQCELLPTWIESVSTRQENTEIIYCLWNSTPEINLLLRFPLPENKTLTH